MEITLSLNFELCCVVIWYSVLPNSCSCVAHEKYFKFCLLNCFQWCVLFQSVTLFKLNVCSTINLDEIVTEKLFFWNRGHWRHEEGCQYWHTGRQRCWKEVVHAELYLLLSCTVIVYICLITKYNYNSGLLAVPYCHYVDIKPCIDFTSVSFRCKGYIFQYSFKAKWKDLLDKSVEMAKNFSPRYRSLMLTHSDAKHVARHFIRTMFLPSLTTSAFNGCNAGT